MDIAGLAWEERSFSSCWFHQDNLLAPLENEIWKIKSSLFLPPPPPASPVAHPASLEMLKALRHPCECYLAFTASREV